MSKLPIRAALAGAAVLLALAACNPIDPTHANGPAAPIRECDIHLAAPRLDMSKGVPTILAETRATCDVTPSTHIVHITLEKADGLAWDIVGNFSCSEIPSPGHDARCAVRVPCVDGVYRTRVLVTGSGQGRDFAFAPDEKPQAPVQCQL